MPAKTDTAILLRVHYWDEALTAFAADLHAHLPYDLHILADETNGHAGQLPYPTLGLGKDFSAQHGLLDRFPQVTWRCGDYFLYLARERLPGYRFYWMIEHDVRLHFKNPHECLGRFDDAADAGLIACGYRPAETWWRWGDALAGAAPLYRCAYSLVRLSGEAIDVLRAERQALTQRFARENLEPTRWPNDEAFTATTLTAKGFICRDINSFGRRLYDDSSFDFFRPEPLSALLKLPPDDKIHHPVLHGIHLFNKWMTIAFCAKNFDFDWLADYVRRLTGEEWSEAQANQLLDHIAKLRLQPARHEQPTLKPRA